MQGVLADQVPVIFLWFERYVTVANSDLHDYKPGHVGSQWWNAWEWSIWYSSPKRSDLGGGELQLADIRDLGAIDGA